jgi:hypothetical protein
MEELGKNELPAGLSWSNTLATLHPISLLKVARREFKLVLAERPEDLELQERVRGYFEKAHEGLLQEPEPEAMVEALGEFEDILPG